VICASGSGYHSHNGYIFRVIEVPLWYTSHSGYTGMAIIRAILAGERDGLKLPR
jgi:hypothetical protein